jgi:two-component system sensor histidine kinase AgrC
VSLISIVFSSSILTFFYLLISCKLFNKKINFKDYTVILGIIALILIIPTLSIYLRNFIRIAVNLAVFTIFYRVIFKEDLFRSFLVSFITIGFLFVSEIIFCLLLLILFNVDANILNQSWVNTIGANLFIGLIAYLLLKIKPLREVINKLLNGHKDPKYNELLIITIFIIGITANYNVTVLGFNIEYVTNILLIILFVYIVYNLFKEKIYKDQIYARYDQLFNYIQKYEEELNKKNIAIHTFKNQIISVKGFISKSNKKANNYLDSILNELKSDKTNLLADMENVPKGGLKGLIYYKLCDLNDHQMKITTNISSNLKRSKISKIEPEIYKNIVKVFGVLLDNAIESSKLSKEKQIMLEMYIEKSNLHFILSNTYLGELEIDKFDNVGYSTKGKGRGYGLTLVKQIISKYDFIKQEREIANNYYIVHLTINLKDIPIFK